MRFVAGLSTKSHPVEATEDLVGQVRATLGPAKIDVAFLFLHGGWISTATDIVDAVRSHLAPRVLVGCTGGGIIGERQEIEDRPAISLLAGELPGTDAIPFRVTPEDLDKADGPAYWHGRLALDPAGKHAFVLLADPYSLPAISLVNAWTGAYPTQPLIGGLASGGQQAGENRLFLNDRIHTDGAVGVALTGRVTMHAVVSPGCRPIGEPLVVTRAERNILLELGGQPPIRVLEELMPRLPARDQQLARTSLLLGRVINEYQESFGPGDFLVRTLIGQDPRSGALAVGDLVHAGQTVQFQLRDGQSADEELQHLLAAAKDRLGNSPARGALVFSCLGRGREMYGVPDHDVTALRRVFGPVPSAGFFCNGEIGPQGDRAYVHGFTSVVGLFAEP